jgi:hypothetical protein
MSNAPQTFSSPTAKTNRAEEVEQLHSPSKNS